MKITQIKLANDLDISQAMKSIEQLSKKANVFVIYYRVFSEREKDIYHVESSYRVRSLDYVWNIDNDQERKERIALHIMDGKSGLIRIR